mmetsp:Transcript_25085/g.49115  ORF Transcript_25085/g.49115 Transcript_25085/m.49115 type:complete len:220 (-) Transcript_25085:243-902(-)
MRGMAFEARFGTDELGCAFKHYISRARSHGHALDIPESDIRWIQVAGGFLAARARPQGKSMLSVWKCTALVTLIEDGDHTIEGAAKELDVEWVHAPVQPISNARKAICDLDAQSFRKIDDVLDLLKAGERVVVHCQAGCHRTGIFCYVILRRAGYLAEEALSALQLTRQVTWEEIVAVTKKRPEGLQPKAEAIFQAVFHPNGADGDHALKRCRERPCTG